MMFEPISPQELLSSLRDARLPYSFADGGKKAEEIDRSRMNFALTEMA
jgi:hypothetical protein